MSQLPVASLAAFTRRSNLPVSASMKVVNSAGDALSATIQYFPYAHIEALLTGKVEAQGEDLDHPGSYVMLMLHYYL